MSKFLDIPENELPFRAILTDDPMRVEMFVAHHLEQAKLYTRQRGMTGYIGSYAGVPVIVQSVGYGMASLVAYLNELVSLYGIHTVVYAGECVSRESSVLLHDLVVASRAYTGATGLEANPELLKNAILASRQSNLPVRTNMVHTDDGYGTQELEPCCARACIIDYATYGLYEYANKHGISALSLLEVAESNDDWVSPAERQSQFHGLARLAFETVII
jgi:purine-nucleoside phosphorylase